MKDYIMFLFAILLTIMTTITVGVAIWYGVTWFRDWWHWRWKR